MSAEDPAYIKFTAINVSETGLPSGARQLKAELIATVPSIALKNKIFDTLMEKGVRVYVSETLHDQVITVLKEDLEKERRRVQELEAELRRLRGLEGELAQLSTLTVNPVVT